MGAAPGSAGINQNHFSVADILGPLWEFVWNADDVAGLGGVLRSHQAETLALLKAVKDHHDHVAALVAKNLSLDNWNDSAGQGFQARHTELLKEGEQLMKTLTEKAKALGDFADQVANFNDCFHQLLITIAISIGISVGASWIPVVDIFTTAGTAATVAADADEAWNLVSVVRTVLGFLRSGFFRLINFIGRNLPNIVRNIGGNLRLQEFTNFGLRYFERTYLFGGDGTKGWSKYDAAQIFFANLQNVLLTSFIIGPVKGGPAYGPLGRWAALSPPPWLPNEAEMPEWALEQVPELGLGKEAWLSFLRSSASRLLVVGGTATLYNFVNLGLIQGKGLNFDIAGSLEHGTLFSLGTTLVFIVGGNALVFALSGGTQGLPQAFTVPTTIAVNGVLDVAIPGLSPLIRGARGYVYYSSAGQITPQVLDIVKNTTGIAAQLPTLTVGANDTLDLIALRQYGEVNPRIIDDILKANHLNSATDIYTGENLVMPGLRAGDY